MCKVPEIPGDPLVDVLIGQDCIDLHFVKCDVKGEAGEPIARLGPLGWSCIGNPERFKSSVATQPRTNLVYTFVAKSYPVENISQILKRLWEVESIEPALPEGKVMSGDEKHALSQARKSLVHDGERYESWNSVVRETSCVDK